MLIVGIYEGISLKNTIICYKKNIKPHIVKLYEDETGDIYDSYDIILNSDSDDDIDINSYNTKSTKISIKKSYKLSTKKPTKKSTKITCTKKPNTKKSNTKIINLDDSNLYNSDDLSSSDSDSDNLL